MTHPKINVKSLFSLKPLLQQTILDAYASNFLHSDILACYCELAKGQGLEDVYESIIKAYGTAEENQSIIEVGIDYVNAILKSDEHNCLPN